MLILNPARLSNFVKKYNPAHLLQSFDLFWFITPCPVIRKMRLVFMRQKGSYIIHIIYCIRFKKEVFETSLLKMSIVQTIMSKKNITE